MNNKKAQNPETGPRSQPNAPDPRRRAGATPLDCGRSRSCPCLHFCGRPASATVGCPQASDLRTNRLLCDQCVIRIKNAAARPLYLIGGAAQRPVSGGIFSLAV